MKLVSELQPIDMFVGMKLRSRLTANILTVMQMLPNRKSQIIINDCVDLTDDTWFNYTRDYDEQEGGCYMHLAENLEVI